MNRDGYGERAAARRRDENVAEARRVMELSARHQVGFEYTADGWRMFDAEAVMSSLPPFAGELELVAS